MKPKINTKAISPIKVTPAALVFLCQKSEGEAGESLPQGGRGRQRQRRMLCQRFCSYLLAVLMLRCRVQVPWGRWYLSLSPLPVFSFSSPFLPVLCSPVVLCSSSCSLCFCLLSSPHTAIHSSVSSRPAPCIPAEFSAGDLVLPHMASEAAVLWCRAQLFAAGSSSPLHCDSNAGGVVVWWTGAGRQKGTCWSDSLGCRANSTCSHVGRLLEVMQRAAKACLHWHYLWNQVFISAPSVLPERREEHRHKWSDLTVLSSCFGGTDAQERGMAKALLVSSAWGWCPVWMRNWAGTLTDPSADTQATGKRHALVWEPYQIPNFKALLQSIVSQKIFNKVIGHFVLNGQIIYIPWALFSEMPNHF